jgi:hypothetical protein
MRLQLVIEGSVLGAETRGVLAGIVVKAFIGRATRPAAGSVTSQLGVFTIAIDAASHPVLGSNVTLKFGLYLPEAKTAFHMTAPVRLARLIKDRILIEVPAAALASAFSKPRLSLLANGEPEKEIEVGQSLSIAGSRFQPATTHEVRLRLNRREVATLSLATDQFGVFDPTVIIPQLGLWTFDSGEALTLKQGVKTFGGQTLVVEVRYRDKVAATAKIAVSGRSSRPLGFVSDPEGRVRNAIQHDRDSLHLTFANLPRASSARVFIVRRQGDWNVGDPITPVNGRNGRPLALDVERAERQQTVTLTDVGQVLPGAYDLIVRPVRYGFEEDEEPVLGPRDIVIGRNITGLVVQENFWLGKPVLGGCVNAVPISGASVSERPYFHYRDTFAVGENVWAALDPGIVMPSQIGRKVAFYVIQSKTAAQWGASTALTHVPADAITELIVQSGCINVNKALVWTAAGPKGDYDIIADFGNNDPNPANFVKDGSYDTPLDMIDGYFSPGFRIVDDPGTMSEFAHAGAFNIDAPLLAGLGLGANLTVQDESGAYFPPGGFVPSNQTWPRLAIVRFPADFAGATNASQMSATKASYPLAVVVHGNGHNYTNYGFLLDHLARNGFVAMSIHIPNNRHGLGRANAFFDHLDTIRLIFGSKLQNNVGVLGHSRGGEVVFKIARLNNSLALGIGLKALVSLAPTDQYGNETINGAAAVPLFVLYGAKDCDVSGWPPYAGYNVRQTGFSLYDRYDDKDKSMAFVYDATHNGFVTAANESPPPPVLTVADQQKVLLAYTNAFFRMQQRNEPEWAGMFTGEWKPPSVGATPAEIYFQYRDTQRRAVDNFEGAHTATSWQTSTIGDTVTQAGLPANPTETQLYPQDNQSPHDTGGLRLAWDNNGDELNFAIPPGQRDVSAFSVLSVRVTQVVNSPSNPPGAQNFRLALRDGLANERWIRVGAFGKVPEPAAANVAGNKKSAMVTIRIPLSAYTIVCAGAVKVDLTDVTNVKLQFLDNAAGEIAVDELEFAN